MSDMSIQANSVKGVMNDEFMNQFSMERQEYEQKIKELSDQIQTYQENHQWIEELKTQQKGKEEKNKAYEEELKQKKEQIEQLEKQIANLKLANNSFYQTNVHDSIYGTEEEEKNQSMDEVYEEELKQKKERIEQLEIDIANEKAEKNSLGEELKQKKERIEQLEKQIAKLKLANNSFYQANVHDSIYGTEEEKNQSKTEPATIPKKPIGFESFFDQSSKEEELNEMKEKIKSLRKDNDEILSEKNRLQEMVNKWQLEATELRNANSTELTQLRLDNSKYKDTNVKIMNENESLRTQVLDLQNQIEKLGNDYAKLQSKNEENLEIHGS